MRPTDLPPQAQRSVERQMSRRLLGVALLLGGLGWLLFELFSQGSIAGINLNLAPADSQQSISTQRFVVARVEVTGVNDQVVLTGATGEEVVLSGEQRGFGWAANAAAAAAAQITVETEQRGDTLYINVRRQVANPWNFGRAPYARLELALPDDVTFTVALVSGEAKLRQLAASGSVKTVSGAIQAEDTTGDLRLETTSGDLELRNHRGRLQVETISGDLAVTGQITELNAQTASGDVEARGVIEVARVQTVSGDIVIETAEPAQVAIDATSGKVAFTGRLAATQHSITTISGDIDLNLLPPVDARLTLSTVSGRLRAPASLTTAEANLRSLNATLGDGSALLNVSSTSGDIQLSTKPVQSCCNRGML